MKQHHRKVLSSRQVMLWLVSALLLAPPAAQAQLGPPPQIHIYTVGPSLSTGCDYLSLRAALADAVNDTGPAVEIRESRLTDVSLGYSYGGSQVGIYDPAQQSISIVGGYASCSASSPTPGARTVLTYTANPATDEGYSLLDIDSDPFAPRFYLTLKNIEMRGAGNTTGGPTFGGAINLLNETELTLDNSEIDGFHASDGGGIRVAMYGYSFPFPAYPHLSLINGSTVDHNSADFGGGILANFATVRLAGATVSHNQATHNGGGIWIGDSKTASDPANPFYNVALTLDSGFGQNSIDFNTAGSGVFSASSGFGGGIYSVDAQLRFEPHLAGTPQFQSHVVGNSANEGGGIYVRGPDLATGGYPIPITLFDSSISGNTATGSGGAIFSLNAVDWVVDSSGGQCHGGSSGQSPCSVFIKNSAKYADPSGFSFADGGAAYIYDSAGSASSPGSVQFSRTLFEGNSDPHGVAAVVATGGSSTMAFNRDIFTGNTAATGGASLSVKSALIVSPNGNDVDFRYNTVLDSNTTTRMFNMTGGKLDVTGSILWGSIDHTYPFHFVWFAQDGATMKHNNCLLVRRHDNGLAGIPNTSLLLPWAGYAPDLDADFAPRARSAAIDFCDNFTGPPPLDAYGHGTHDDPGVAARWDNYLPYNYDLGAVEQTDVIFSSSFGKRDASVGAPPDYPPEY